MADAQVFDLDFQCHPHSVQSFQPDSAKYGNVQSSLLVVDVFWVAGIEYSFWAVHAQKFSLSVHI
jgi:hypothetical protein